MVKKERKIESRNKRLNECQLSPQVIESEGDLSAQKKIPDKVIAQAKELFLKKTLKLDEPWRSWYQIHAKHVGLAGVNLSSKKQTNLFKLCGWLHDITKIDQDPEHAKSGAIFAKLFLTGKLPTPLVQKIAEMISTHSKHIKPISSEGRIFQEADNLATFYPAVQKFILKKVGKEALEKNLTESYHHLKSKKAISFAKKHSKLNFFIKPPKCMKK